MRPFKEEGYLKMYEKRLEELEFISRAVGLRSDYVQGGGGNTSVKLDEKLMAVKASGFLLKGVTRQEGFVVVDYRKIKDYYQQVDLDSDRDFEKESAEFAKNSVVEMPGLKTLRPSVEAGFHSFLKTHVIHTHPVYANILCCSVEGRELARSILESRGYSWVWVPYINPGFCLTLKIKQETEACLKSSGSFPRLVLMENHGLIVTEDGAEKCVAMHEEVNRLIAEQLKVTEAFPEPRLEKLDEETYISRTPYLKERMRDGAAAEYFKNVLYPDQLVYLGEGISFDGGGGKVSVDTKTGEVKYKAGFQEALTMEEIMLAVLYITEGVKKAGLTLKAMTGEDIDFIKNWESEAYRKSLVKQMGK